jgi:hypothetical protein
MLMESAMRSGQKAGMSEADVESFAAELQRFLDVCAESDAEVIVPSEDLDYFWHEFILDTRRYLAFCVRRYGKVIHHAPPDVSDAQRCGKPPESDDPPPPPVEDPSARAVAPRCGGGNHSAVDARLDGMLDLVR